MQGVAHHFKWTRLVMPACLAVLVLTAVGSGQANSEQLREQVRRAWAERQELVRSLKLVLSGKETTPAGGIGLAFPDLKDARSTPSTDVTHTTSATLLIDGRKSRLSVRTKRWNEPQRKFVDIEEESSFDGQTYSRSTIGGQRFPGGVVHKSNQNESANMIEYWPIWCWYRGLDDGLMSREGFAVYTDARPGHFDGKPAVQLVCPRNETRGEAHLWLDPAQGCVLRRYDNYERTGGLSTRVTVLRERTVGGVPVPVSWKTWLYIDGKLFRLVELTVTESVVNPPSAPSDFQLRFPVGAWVYDTTEGEAKEYIVREGDIRPVPREERGIKYDRLIETEPGQLTSGSSSARGGRRIIGLLIGSALVVVPIAVLLTRRHIRRRVV